MVFFFLIPSIPAVLGNFLMPLMIGARDLAFPRLNLLSWYIYMLGGLFTIYALVAGGVDTGWTFYTPYSTMFSNTQVIAAALGIFIVGFSSILTGLNFIVTIHTMRAPGMTWLRLPLFVWAHYATSLIIVLGTPVLAITILLVAVERLFKVGIFDPALGGDPLLFQHLFWFYSHPAVYIMILPGLGVISELVTCFARKKIFGYIVHGRGHAGDRGPRLPGLGAPHVRLRPVDVRRHDLLDPQLPGGRPLGRSRSSTGRPRSTRARSSFKTPMLYALGFIGLFTIGGLTGLFLASLADRRARARHLLRRRPLPLHHGRRHGDGLPGRPPLLVAEDHRPDVLRSSGARSRRSSSSSAST